MPAPILLPTNRLEAGTVTVTGAAAGKPKERLFDRDITLPWVDSSASGNRDVKLDLGPGTTLAIDTLVLAAGHNLTGVSCAWASSPDDAVYTDRATFAPASAALVRQAFASQTFRYWRFRMASPGVPPSIPELFASLAVALPDAPALGGDDGLRANVLDHESYAGYVWSLKRGAERWVARYPFPLLPAADKTALLAAFSALAGGAKAFYLVDREGTTRWARWPAREPRFRSVGTGQGVHYSGVLELEEAL
jgi:hypothetical protein